MSIGEKKKMTIVENAERIALCVDLIIIITLFAYSILIIALFT